MSEEAAHTPETLEDARKLVAALEAGDVAGANALLDGLTRMRETELYRELGQLTRNLHDALNAFRFDDRLVKLAEYEIPDARERLRYVVTKTEQAAHRTLKAVEESIPLARELEDQARRHKTHWDRFLRREMQVEEFRSLTRTLGDFLDDVTMKSTALHRNLSDVLLAQDYQDLTGQVIDRVINLVQEMEKNLVDMIRVTGQRMLGQQAPAPGGPASMLEGPQINPQQRTDVVSNQDDVDQLLASLGF
jgi:chemotaxis protein CheZ